MHILKSIIIFVLGLELLKVRHMRENNILKYYRIGLSEGCRTPVPTDFRYGFLIFFYGGK